MERAGWCPKAYELEESIQNIVLEGVSFGAKKRKEVLIRHLDDIRNERYKRLIETMITIFYAYSMEDSYLVHVDAMYDAYWGAFLHEDRSYQEMRTRLSMRMKSTIKHSCVTS